MQQEIVHKLLFVDLHRNLRRAWRTGSGRTGSAAAVLHALLESAREFCTSLIELAFPIFVAVSVFVAPFCYAEQNEN